MTMITCPNCGRRFAPEGVAFCPGADCGYPVDFMTQRGEGVTEDETEAEVAEGVLRRPEEEVTDAPPTESERSMPTEVTDPGPRTEDQPRAPAEGTPTTVFPQVSSPSESAEAVPPVERAPRPAPSAPVLLGIAAAVVLLVGLGSWALLSGSDDDPVIGGGSPAEPGGADAAPAPDPDDGGGTGDGGDQGGQGDPEPDTFEVQVFFADSEAIANQDPPFVRPVPRRIPTPEADPRVGRNTLTVLLQGPTQEEQAAGLALVASGISGIGAVDLVGNVFVVQLTGGCDHANLPVTIADLITPSLKQFATVDFVRILDPQGNTQRPDEAADSIPDCLDRAA